MAIPPSLSGDTSTELTLSHFEQSELHSVVGVVSNNHFDEDGLFSLIDPEAAIVQRDPFTVAARVGDFGVVTDIRAAELALHTPAELLPTILADVEEYYEHRQDQHLTDSRSWLEDGSVTIEKRRDLDLVASAWAASADCSDVSRHIPR